MAGENFDLGKTKRPVETMVLLLRLLEEFFWLVGRLWDDVVPSGDVGDMVLADWGLFFWFFGSRGLCYVFPMDEGAKKW